MNENKGRVISMASISITRVYQTEIKDAWASKLCMWLCEMWMAWSLLRRKDKNLAPFTREDLDRLNNACIKNGGLARLNDEDSDNGFVKNHERNAEAVGLFGYKKIYEPMDPAKVIALLQWGAIVELRDEGRHSMLAIGWYQEDGKTFLEMFDPWKKTNDGRLDCARNTTQRLVDGKWVDSRTVEFFAWYYKVGTNPKWIE